MLDEAAAPSMLSSQKDLVLCVIGLIHEFRLAMIIQTEHNRLRILRLEEGGSRLENTLECNLPCRLMVQLKLCANVWNKEGHESGTVSRNVSRCGSTYTIRVLYKNHRAWEAGRVISGAD